MWEENQTVVRRHVYLSQISAAWDEKLGVLTEIKSNHIVQQCYSSTIIEQSIRN